jgi:putative DNA primase/helicase
VNGVTGDGLELGDRYSGLLRGFVLDRWGAHPRRDKELEAKLKQEWPGILQWMIDGCLLWQEHGLAPPEIVTKMTNDYFVAQDSFTAWIEDRCQRDPNVWVKTADLFTSWKDWAEHAGVRHGSIKEFTRELVGAGMRFTKRNTGNG